MTTALEIQHAMASLLLGTPDFPMLRADNTPVIRQTTLAVSAEIGDPYLTLTDLTGWTIGSPVSFADTSGEKRLYVAENWDGTNPLPLDFTGRGITGLEHRHEAGTVVYTDLFDFAPMDLDPSLSNGDPAIFIRTFHVPWHIETVPDGNLGVFSVLLQYTRRLTPPDEEDGTRINANAWAERQQAATHEDMALINECLLGNEQLITLYEPGVALQMAPLGGKGEKTVLTFEPIAEPGMPWHFVATLRATYVGEISPH